MEPVASWAFAWLWLACQLKQFLKQMVLATVRSLLSADQIIEICCSWECLWRWLKNFRWCKIQQPTCSLVKGILAVLHQRCECYSIDSLRVQFKMLVRCFKTTLFDPSYLRDFSKGEFSFSVHSVHNGGWGKVWEAVESYSWEVREMAVKKKAYLIIYPVMWDDLFLEVWMVPPSPHLAFKKVRD